MSDLTPGSSPTRRGETETVLDAQVVERLLLPITREQPYPLLFATVSGAHLYGFPSPDSDYDLRGVHLLPLREVIGLEEARETVELAEMRDGVEIDLVTHDLKKFLTLLLRPNGYVLEQLYSPLVVQTTPEHAELQALAQNCITSAHSRHYLGFAESQWRLFQKEQPHRVKPLLYVFRVLLTGIHLMRTGEIEANLRCLNADDVHLPHLSYLDDLIARKLAGPEQSTLDATEDAFYEAEYARLRAELEAASVASNLPAQVADRRPFDDFLARIRLTGLVIV